MHFNKIEDSIQAIYMICPKRTQRRIPHSSVSEAVRCVGAFGALSKCGIVAVWGLSHSAPILRRVAAVTLAGPSQLSPQLRFLRRRQHEEIIAGRK